jgi:hypothetical protein
MKCSEAVKHSAGLGLDDLDIEVRRELEGHIAACAACRGVAERERRAVEVLRSAPAAETSAARRERVAEAMDAAYRELAERAVLAPRSPRRWWVGVAAAVVLAALAVPLLFSNGDLKVEWIKGTAWVLRAGAKERIALQPGDKVRRGDLVTTEGVLSLTGPGRTKIAVNEGSEVMVDLSSEGPLLRLAKGALYGEVRGTELSVVDPSDGRLTIREGAFEAKLAVVLGPGNHEKKSTFSVQVGNGNAVLHGPRGSVKLEKGQKGSVTGSGLVTPEEPAPGPLAPWRKQP